MKGGINLGLIGIGGDMVADFQSLLPSPNAAAIVKLQDHPAAGTDHPPIDRLRDREL